jgi:hypothetical protein
MIKTTSITFLFCLKCLINFHESKQKLGPKDSYDKEYAILVTLDEIRREAL